MAELIWIIVWRPFTPEPDTYAYEHHKGAQT